MKKVNGSSAILIKRTKVFVHKLKLSAMRKTGINQKNDLLEIFVLLASKKKRMVKIQKRVKLIPKVNAPLVQKLHKNRTPKVLIVKAKSKVSQERKFFGCFSSIDSF